MEFLPVSKEDMTARNIRQLDFIMITGDAYVDHVSFGAALISRWLEKHGYSVGIIPQPDWRKADDFTKLGAPLLAFLVTGGNIDSMVNHYSVAKKRRKTDAYSPNGEPGLRPDRALIVYSKKLREQYKNIPIIAGGLEAGLRRLAHYDYWSDKVRRSILLDSDCDLLVYGMGERQIAEIAKRLKNGESIGAISGVPGIVYKTRDVSGLTDVLLLPDYKTISANKAAYAESFRIQYQNTDAITAKTLIEPYGNIYVVQNKPTKALSRSEMDSVYGMKFLNRPHEMYTRKGKTVPAIEEVKFSVTSSRGCFGACNFCALTFHQGRTVTSRSHKSIIEEVRRMTLDPDFKGYVHDVGGPTANFRIPSCKDQIKRGVCPAKRCLFPKPCAKLEADHSDYIKLLTALRQIPGVKKVFIRSGIRYDYVLADKKTDFLEQLALHHVSGQLKIAPEHISPEVLRCMGKPCKETYEKFVSQYYELNKRFNKEQYIVPYLMSSHPGSALKSAIELALYLHGNKLRPEQVQDFYPTPSTISTCMYYTGINPETGERVYVAKNPHEKAMQRALIQYYLPQNRALVIEALKKAGRMDLIVKLCHNKKFSSKI